MSAYYIILILPALALCMPLANAFRARDLMEDNWRGIAAVTFSLTFPAWVLAAHTISHFILAALDRGPWEIHQQNLMTVPHYLLTAAQCGVLSAVVIGWLARSWLLFGACLINAVPTAALMVFETPGVGMGMGYWLVATVIAVTVWGRSAPKRRVVRTEPAASAEPDSVREQSG